MWKVVCGWTYQRGTRSTEETSSRSPTSGFGALDLRRGHIDPDQLVFRLSKLIVEDGEGCMCGVGIRRIRGKSRRRRCSRFLRMQCDELVRHILKSSSNLLRGASSSSQRRCKDIGIRSHNVNVFCEANVNSPNRDQAYELSSTKK